MSGKSARAPGPSGSTSISLLQRVRSNDPGAWSRLVNLYGPLIYQWCLRWDLSADDAADVSQEVFQVVAARIADFKRERKGDSFRGWLWTITRNKIGDHFRRLNREPAGAGGSEFLRLFQEVPEQLPQDERSETETAALVHRALELIRAEFEERTWQAFWRVTVLGHLPRDVAEETGVSVHAVRMAKSRVLRRLRDELDGGFVN
jgi:RNA polymerase sigma-70 factor, ECF subfamily